MSSTSPTSAWPKPSRTAISTSPPELTIEVVSPNDRWTEIDERVSEDLACGVEAVWIIDPRNRRVTCYRSPDEARIYGEDDVIEEPGILPGLALAVRELFD